MLKKVTFRGFLTTTMLLASGITWAGSSVNFSKSFSPATIGPGSNSLVVFTIDNFSANPVTSVSFTDPLPAGVTISNPSLAQTNCTLPIGAGLSAPNGGTTITLSDAEIGGNQSCTISVAVTASTPGTHTNPAVTLTSSAGSTTSQPVDLIVDTGLPGFSKSFAPATVNFGDRSRLSFTIDNSVNALPVSNLDFVDNLPTGLVIADPANIVTDCGDPVIGDPTITAIPGSNQITFDADGISQFPAVGSGAICQVAVDVVAETAASVDNQSDDLLADFVSAGFAVATLDVNRTNLALVKEFENDPVQPGDLVNLAFTIYNFNRNFSATGIAFDDDLNATLSGLIFNGVVFNDCGGTANGVGTGLLSYSGGTLAPQASCTLRIALAIPAGATPGVYNNTSGAISGTVDGNPEIGNAASDDLFINFDPVFTKEFIDDPVASGGQVTLRFTITNTNPNAGLSNLEFDDDIGGVDPRNGAVPGMAANGLVAGNGLDPAPITNVCGPGSELTIDDFNDTNPSPPSPNFPPDPTLLKFSGGNLAPAGNPGDSCTFDVVLDIPVGTSSGTYTNITSTLSSDAGSSPAASDHITVVGGPELQMNFTDDPVAPGGTVTLEFTLIHSADATGNATGISFSNDLSTVLSGLTVNLPVTPDPPCGAGSSLTGSAGDTFLTFAGGQLSAGESCVFSVTLDVPVSAGPGNYTNTTSEVSATVGGLSTQSAAAFDDLEITGLLFSKEFIDDPVIPGGTTTLRFTIDNIHPTEDATSLSFSDNLADVLPGSPDLTAQLPPAVNTCGGTLSGTTNLTYSGGAVTAGNSCLIEVVIDVPVGVADGTYQNITSSLSAFQGVTVIVPPANDTLTINSEWIQLTKLFTDDPVAAGDTVTLQFTLHNLDSVNALSGLAFSDDLDATLTGLSATGLPMAACGGTVAAIPSTSVIDFSGGFLAAGASCNFAVTLSVPGSTSPGNYTNTTTQVDGTINGLAVYGSPATDQLDVVNLVQFSQSFDGPTTATGTAVLTFTIDNTSGNNTTNLSFTNDLDATLSGLVAVGLPQSNDCGVGSQLSGTSFITFSGGQLANGDNCQISVTVQVPVTATAGSYTNTSSTLTDNGLLVADASSSQLDIEPPPLFSKSFAPDFIGINQISTVSFLIDNSTSSLTANNLDFTDNLPAGMVVATPANGGSTCSGGTLTAVDGSTVISYSGGQVAAGASCTLQVDVTATASGVLNNVTGDLTSSSGNSGTAAATLTVTDGIALTKSFVNAGNIQAGDTVEMQLTLTNLAGVAVSNISVSDDLDAFISSAVAVNTPLNNVCGAGSTVTGTSVITLSNGSLAPSAVCQFSVMVSIPVQTPPGAYANTTGAVTADINGQPWNGGAASTASANLNIAGSGVVQPVPGLNGVWTWLLLFSILGFGLFFSCGQVRRQQL